METAPRAAFAAATRRAIEAHEDWDSPYYFLTLHPDGSMLATGTIAQIHPAIDPDAYPALITRIALERELEHPDRPACGYLFQFEGFHVPPFGPDASAADRELLERDTRTRNLRKRDDAVEAAWAYCADVHGRMWSATKTRADPGTVQEHFYPPGRSPGGHIAKALRSCGYATGVTAWGLPGPQGSLN